MNPFRSVGARLSLALAVVVAGALAVVWVALVPTLQRKLVDGRLSLLAQSARQIEELSSGATVDQDVIDDAARTADATRAVYLQPITAGGTTTLLALADSRRTGTASAQSVSNDPVALRAAASLTLQRGEVTRSGESFAEVAIPDRLGNVFLFLASLHATQLNVDLVRSRLLWAGLVALGLAVLAGWVASSVFARRIRRLERAADRIAAGDFGQPVVDRAGDELGELATAFDRMRLQLAQLDDARRAFIANASHELRTPIFSLGGFLELLQDEDLDEPTRVEFLGTMSEQVQRLSKLATDLLDLSRLDAGGIIFVSEPLALDDLAQDLADEFAALALQRRPSAGCGDRRGRRRPGRPGAGAPDRPGARRQRATAHARRHEHPDRRAGLDPGGRGRRARDPGGAPGAGVRPLHQARGVAGVRYGARAWRSPVSWRNGWAARSGSTSEPGRRTVFTLVLPAGVAESAPAVPV